MAIPETPTPFDKPLDDIPDGIKFVDMTRMQKCVYVTQVIVCIATFGFVFPRI